MSIPMDRCKDRRLYRLRSRNLRLGVYRAASGGFLGLRDKYGDSFVFEEFHRDRGAPYGTASVLEELPDVLPADVAVEESLGVVCSGCGQAASYEPWPDGGSREVEVRGGGRITVSGEWRHAAEVGCAGVRPTSKRNATLFDWLAGMEARYASRHFFRP